MTITIAKLNALKERLQAGITTPADAELLSTLITYHIEEVVKYRTTLHVNAKEIEALLVGPPLLDDAAIAQTLATMLARIGLALEATA